jgi:hypothetical protein
LGSRCTNGDVVEARYQGHVTYLRRDYIKSDSYYETVSIYQARFLHATAGAPD